MGVLRVIITESPHVGGTSADTTRMLKTKCNTLVCRLMRGNPTNKLECVNVVGLELLLDMLGTGCGATSTVTELLRDDKHTMERFRASSAYTFAALIEKVASSMGKEREAGRGDGAKYYEVQLRRLRMLDVLTGVGGVPMTYALQQLIPSVVRALL